MFNPTLSFSSVCNRMSKSILLHHELPSIFNASNMFHSKWIHFRYSTYTSGYPQKSKLFFFSSEESSKSIKFGCTLKMQLDAANVWSINWTWTSIPFIHSWKYCSPKLLLYWLCYWIFKCWHCWVDWNNLTRMLKVNLEHQNTLNDFNSHSTAFSFIYILALNFIKPQITQHNTTIKNQDQLHKLLSNLPHVCVML